MTDKNRQYVKVHKDAIGIKLIFDLSKKEIVYTNQKFRTHYLTKFAVGDIVYDDHVAACFYDDNDHPLVYVFGRNFIRLARMFSSYGMTVMVSNIKDEFAHILIFPKEKVKPFL